MSKTALPNWLTFTVTNWKTPASYSQEASGVHVSEVSVESATVHSQSPILTMLEQSLVENPVPVTVRTVDDVPDLVTLERASVNWMAVTVGDRHTVKKKLNISVAPAVTFSGVQLAKSAATKVQPDASTGSATPACNKRNKC